MKKIIVLFSIIFALFVGVNVYAEDASFQCGTSPETVRATTNALIQKKMMKLNINSLYVWDKNLCPLMNEQRMEAE